MIALGFTIPLYGSPCSLISTEVPSRSILAGPHMIENTSGFSPCDGASCTKCSSGPQGLNMLREKASLNEGHGFSRAVNACALDGFSR